MTPYYKPEDLWTLDIILRKAEASSGWPFWKTVDVTLAVEKAHNHHTSKDNYKHPDVFKQVAEIRRELMGRIFSS